MEITKFKFYFTLPQKMAKLKGPLFSLSASGRVGGVLTFSERKETHLVRYQREQKDYENTARKTARDPFRWGIVLWNSMPQAEKDYWKEIDRKGYVDI